VGTYILKTGTFPPPSGVGVGVLAGVMKRSRMEKKKKERYKIKGK
jgi:hypothetical protein